MLVGLSPRGDGDKHCTIPLSAIEAAHKSIAKIEKRQPFNSSEGAGHAKESFGVKGDIRRRETNRSWRQGLLGRGASVSKGREVGWFRSL